MSNFCDSTALFHSLRLLFKTKQFLTLTEIDYWENLQSHTIFRLCDTSPLTVAATAFQKASKQGRIQDFYSGGVRNKLYKMHQKLFSTHFLYFSEIQREISEGGDSNLVTTTLPPPPSPNTALSLIVKVVEDYKTFKHTVRSVYKKIR